MESIFKCENFDITKVNFFSGNSNGKLTRYVTLAYPNNEIWYLQTPLMRIPFDPYTDNFCVSFTHDLEEFFHNLELYVLDELEKNIVSWYGKHMSRDDIEDIFESSIVQSKSPNFPAFLKVRTDDNVDIYRDKSIIDKSEIKKGMNVKLIINFNKIYINNKKIKIMFNTKQVLVGKEKKETNLPSMGYSMLDSDSDE